MALQNYKCYCLMKKYYCYNSNNFEFSYNYMHRFFYVSKNNDQLCQIGNKTRLVNIEIV